jgi:hypothetical protein
MASLNVLPSYEDFSGQDASEGTLASPTYSAEPGYFEQVVHPRSSIISNSWDNLGWTFETDHMVVNLGPRLWNLHTPAYGLNGVVEGSVKFKGAKNTVNKVTVTVSFINCFILYRKLNPAFS